MARFYAILAVVGWAWTLIVLIYAAWRWSRSRGGRNANRVNPSGGDGKALP
jgi:hypothetical protein